MSRWLKDVVGSMPTVQAIRRIRRRPERDRGAITLLLVIAFYTAIALLTPHCGPLQRRLLESSHYRPRSFASWVLLQPAPKMYGFANRVWRGPFPLVDATTRRADKGRFAATSFWVNHYPARMARYDGERGQVFKEAGRTVFVMIQSRYREAELWTALEIREQDGALEMRSIEVSP